MSSSGKVAAQSLALGGGLLALIASSEQPKELLAATAATVSVEVTLVRRSFLAGSCVHLWVLRTSRNDGSIVENLRLTLAERGVPSEFQLEYLPWAWGAATRSALTLLASELSPALNLQIWPSLRRYLSITSTQEDVAIAALPVAQGSLGLFEGAYLGQTTSGVAFVGTARGVVAHRYQLVDLPKYDLVAMTLPPDWTVAFAEIDKVLVELTRPVTGRAHGLSNVLLASVSEAAQENLHSRERAH